MPGINVSAINKFYGQNYSEWKFQINCTLKAKEVFTVSNGTKTKPDTDEFKIERWEKDDAIATQIALEPQGCDGGRRGSGETCSPAADNDSAMGDIDPRTRPAVPGSSCEHCIEKVRLESEMVKSRVKLEGLLKLSKTTTTQLMTQRSTRP
ncbi:hypothetical protein AVEN_223365-1 [Araneus ventricosus]|uniref:DUF4219 domain-containing protein n=1 Tax=Araneus ventricosus TaxID=182803 RepID=A0A4Y2VAX7_ARAVE|nr:hypothetical protein AVEN_223365-1 [Araneus ventricosus]